MAYRLFLWRDRVPDGWRSVEWPAIDRALRSITQERLLDAIVRVGVAWEPYWDEARTLIDVAHRLILRGELGLYTDEPVPALLPFVPPEPPEPGGKDDPGDPTEPGEGEWIELLVKDQHGQPVPNVRYEVTLPDATVRTGRLDAMGFARLDGIPGGNCKVRFPELPADGTRHL